MNSKQYNDVINWTINHEPSIIAGDSLEITRAIFKNMGISLPNGNLEQINKILESGDYMGWKACNIKTAQENANKGIATIGINNKRIVVLTAADDESNPVLATEVAFSISEKTLVNSVCDLQFYSHNYTTTCCPYYTSFLINDCGFSPSTASLILSLYNRIDSIYCNEGIMEKAWRCTRLLGGIVYCGFTKILFVKIYKWDNVAGKIFEDDADEDEKRRYFTNTLGFTSSEYKKLKNDIASQHNDAYDTDSPDFAHMQISLAARLAYLLDKDGRLSNIAGSDEDVSYLAGWLGDAVLDDNNEKSSFKNDDYCADLDAENIYQYLNEKYVPLLYATNAYYRDLLGDETRADIFLNYTNYKYVENKILSYLSLSNIESIKNVFPDTYNFLRSLKDRLSHIAEY